MRDITHDLRERLAKIASGYAETMGEYQHRRDDLDRWQRDRIASLEREKAAVQQLLEIEECRDGMPTARVDVKKPTRLVSLADFLVVKVQTQGAMDKEQLRAEADLAGYFEDGNGRTFHTTLMNITNGGKLVRLDDGRYDCPNTSLFGNSREDQMQTIM